MVTYKVALAVKETQYMEPLLHYVHSSEFADKLRISGFTKVDTFLQYMNGNDKPDAVIGEAVFLEPWLNQGDKDCPWMMLSTGEATSITGPVLAKYQPLPDLLGSILSMCQRSESGRVLPSSERGTVIIGIVSAVGGSGKTTAAVNMAKQLGTAGLSVLYLNLETVNSSAVFPRPNRNAEDAQGLPRILYEIKAAQEEKGSRAIPSAPFTVHHPGMRCDWFEPVTNMKELIQMGRSDTQKLLHNIAVSGSYDVIIADTDSGMNERLNAVLESSQYLVWLILDDITNMYKNGQWLAFIERSQPELYAEIAGKSRFVVNRYVGNLANALPQLIPQIDEVLPYIPSWKQNSNEELLLSSPIYQRDIQKLCRAMLGEQLGTDFGVRAYG